MLATSRALWNRMKLELESDEVLAQILDQGSLDDWRELYGLAKTDVTMRRRLGAVLTRVPLPMPHFWMAALASLGECVDHDAPLPSYGDAGV